MFIQNNDGAVYMARKICGDFIAVTNEIADYSLTDAMSLLRKNKLLYRQMTKKLANLCCENKHKNGLHDLVTKCRHRAPREDIYITYVDSCYEVIKKDIKILEMTILQELTRCNVPDRELYAKMELTRILLYMSLQAYEEIFRQIKKQTSFYNDFTNFVNSFSDYYVGHVYDMWVKVCDIAMAGRGIKCNLNDSKAIYDAYKVILNKYMRATFLDEGAQATIDEFPDIKPSDIDNI